MKANLIQSTPNKIKLITDIASICYGKDEANDPDKLIRHLDSVGHYSVFEHIHYTFKIEDISRACLAQLTRHRHCSYAVRSQRYCDEGEMKVEIPTDIANNTKAIETYVKAVERSFESYGDMRGLGIKKEDARMVLPNCTMTSLYMSFNLRTFLEMYALRTSKQAQREISTLFTKMKDLIIEDNTKLEFLFEEEL